MSIYNFVIWLIYIKSNNIKSETIQHKFIICIPCHNDFDDLTNLLDDLSRQKYDRSLLQIVVVLDNCNSKFNHPFRDVTFINRTDESKKDKIYALIFGTDYISKQNEDAYIVYIDCDVRLKDDFFEILNSNIKGKDYLVQPKIELFSETDKLFFRLKHLKYNYHIINNVGKSRLNIFNNLNGPLICLHQDVLKKISWSKLIEYNLLPNSDIVFGLVLSLYDIKIYTSNNLSCLVRETHIKNAELRKYRRWFSGKIGRIQTLFPVLIVKLFKKPTLYSITTLLELLAPPTFYLYLVAIIFTIIFYFELNIIMMIIWITILILYLTPLLYYAKKSNINIIELAYGGFYFFQMRLRIIFKNIINQKKEW
ncbi:MAG: glycosyltransferase [Ignavibacteria bacterium]